MRMIMNKRSKILTKRIQEMFCLFSLASSIPVFPNNPTPINFTYSPIIQSRGSANHPLFYVNNVKLDNWTCACDVTKYVCDINCRCDPDCDGLTDNVPPAPEKNGVQSQYYRLCKDPVKEQGGSLIDWFMRTMLCIEFDNNPSLGQFYQFDVNPDQPNPNSFYYLYSNFKAQPEYQYSFFPFYNNGDYVYVPRSGPGDQCVMMPLLISEDFEVNCQCNSATEFAAFKSALNITSTTLNISDTSDFTTNSIKYSVEWNTTQTPSTLNSRNLPVANAEYNFSVPFAYNSTNSEFIYQNISFQENIDSIFYMPKDKLNLTVGEIAPNNSIGPITVQSNYDLEIPDGTSWVIFDYIFMYRTTGTYFNQVYEISEAQLNVQMSRVDEFGSNEIILPHNFQNHNFSGTIPFRTSVRFYQVPNNINFKTERNVDSHVQAWLPF